jgi:DNA-binding transcriptional MerR regulator
MGGTYQVREFAELASVTVRAFHHYDRLDLLKPRRSRAGSRLYEDRDLGRLEQIVALKFLVLNLKQIKTLLNRNAPDLADALRRQSCVLEEKRRCTIPYPAARLNPRDLLHLKHVIDSYRLRGFECFLWFSRIRGVCFRSPQTALKAI